MTALEIVIWVCKSYVLWPEISFYGDASIWDHKIDDLHPKMTIFITVIPILMRLFTFFVSNYTSRDMTKPTKWVCAQRRLRSACASAQSDRSLRCPHEEPLGLYLPIERTAKTLIRLGGCPGWSESSLGAHSFCWFCHVAAHTILDQK